VVGILNDHETAIHAVRSLDGRQAVQDAGGGRLLVRAGDGENAPGGLAVVPTSANPSTDSPLSEVPGVASGDLAPDGKHWFTQDADRFAVFDSQTGDREDPTHPGFVFAAPYQWLDSDTIAAVALRTPESDTISLLTCHVSTNDCAVTAEDVGTYQDVAVPFGAPIGS
jgi:hypothetical protein